MGVAGIAVSHGDWCCRTSHPHPALRATFPRQRGKVKVRRVAAEMVPRATSGYAVAVPREFRRAQRSATMTNHRKRAVQTGMTTIEPATSGDIPALCDLLILLFSQEADFTPDRAKQERGLRLILHNP